MARPSRREVWTVDLGIAGKVRPCLLLTDYPEDSELALTTVIPHTTSLRGNPWGSKDYQDFSQDRSFACATYSIGQCRPFNSAHRDINRGGVQFSPECDPNPIDAFFYFLARLRLSFGANFCQFTDCFYLLRVLIVKNRPFRSFRLGWVSISIALRLTSTRGTPLTQSRGGIRNN